MIFFNDQRNEKFATPDNKAVRKDFEISVLFIEKKMNSLLGI